MKKISICNEWEFTEIYSDNIFNKENTYESIRIPHTCKELPVHYADEKSYQMICGYRKNIFIDKELEGKRLFLKFDGVGHIADIYLNSEYIYTHKSGYTAFEVEITDKVVYGKDNQLVVRVDSTESSNIPPFGNVIDYMTYGGIYREVWLEISDTSRITDVFVKTPNKGKVDLDISIENPNFIDSIVIDILDKEQKNVCKKIIHKEKIKSKLNNLLCEVNEVNIWTIENPYLYTMEVNIKGIEEKVLDTYTVKFGFRQVEFKKDGFYLNGNKVKIRGLNRHQSYPYLGYAMPKSMQIMDADILKYELQVNAVRTSHYPQSQYFIDRCDEIGLLVFTEIPGWQHIENNEEWKNVAYDSVKEMILQYRNHPSIILWGVRINESKDDDEFYKKTNAIAHELDNTRQTSGVRYLWRSNLLEDVYSFNDFSHTGNNKGLLPRKLISPNKNKGYLISEFNGHMYPTKTCDDAAHRLNQAIRHANVLNSIYEREDIAGGFGWCMFDYQTHGDFGSGDRICYHGVMDMFRNPKLAAYVYASSGDIKDVLAVGSDMHIGDYPGGNVGDNYIFTNSDSVRFYKGDTFIKEFIPGKDKRWSSLPHPPISIFDTIGEALENGEGYSHKKSEAIKDCLLAIQRYGTNIPVKYILKALWVTIRHCLSPWKAYNLYNKYIENWGTSAPIYRFEAIKNGKVVAEVIKESNANLSLDIDVSSNILKESETYDIAAIRVRVVDKNNNIASYCQLSINFEVEGDIELVGPSYVCAEGGMCGCYIKSIGKSGKGILKIKSEQTQEIIIEFSIKKEV